MAITNRSVTVGTNNGSSATVTSITPAAGGGAAIAGDLLLIIHSNSFYALSNMPTPTVLPSVTVSPVTGGTADGGTNEGHIKAYIAEVGVGGAQTVAVTETGSADEEKALSVYVLGGVDTTTPIDVAAGFFGTPQNDVQTCPSVAPTSSDALLACHVNSGGSSTTAYTPPGSMAEQYEIHVGAMSGVGAIEQLVASGATGTRTFNCVPGESHLWVSVSVAIKTASAGDVTAVRQPLIVPGLAAIQASNW